MWVLFKTVFFKTLRLRIGRFDEIIPGVVCFLMINVIFYLIFGIDASLLNSIAPALLWVSALFAATLVCERIWVDAYVSGHLDTLAQIKAPLPLVILATLLGYYSVLIVPICASSAFFGVIFMLNGMEIILLMLGLCCGIMAWTFVGALVRAVTVVLVQAPLIYPVLVLPLFLPVVLLGVASITSYRQSSLFLPYIALLAAYALLVMTFVPSIIAKVMRSDEY